MFLYIKWLLFNEILDSLEKDSCWQGRRKEFWTAGGAVIKKGKKGQKGQKDKKSAQKLDL